MFLLPTFLVGRLLRCFLLQLFFSSSCYYTRVTHIYAWEADTRAVNDTLVIQLYVCVGEFG